MIYKVLFWIWFVLIIVLSLLPNTPKNKMEIGNIIFRIDYLEHLIVYFLLGFLFIMYQRTNTSMIIGIYIIMGIAWASLTEAVQLFVKGRTFNPVDLVYNSAGITLGLLITWIINRKYYSEKKVSTKV
jgi:VanZ family protein